MPKVAGDTVSVSSANDEMLAVKLAKDIPPAEIAEREKVATSACTTNCLLVRGLSVNFPQNLLSKFAKLYVKKSKEKQHKDKGLNLLPEVESIPTALGMFRAMGMTPDPWQARFLANSSKRQMVLACRRAGKS